MTDEPKTAARRYTLDEIDRMRKAIGVNHPYYDSGRPPTGDRSHGLRFDDTAQRESHDRYRAEAIESELRTCMIAGVGPEEIEARAEKQSADLQAIYARFSS